MNEVQFQHQNRAKWQQFEEMIRRPGKTSPDELARLYIEITDDLAYAQTNFPDSSVPQYLNVLAARTHHLIYQNKRESGGRIKTFWVQEFPFHFWENQRFFWLSLAIFSIAIAIGAISAANDDTFVRMILGDRYVDMTLANIDKGDPMAVYKSSRNVEMFLGITINNIRVSFFAFTMGIFAGIGTVWAMFSNGIMLGSFQYFFYDHDLLYESVLSIWIHGTLEIFAIIVAGAAGLMVGSYMLFPGTYKRITSIKTGVRKAIKLVIGLIPVFIAAGFLEGFVTRYTNMPDWSRIGIIIASLAFIVWYFFIYARRIYLRYNAQQNLT